MSVIARVPALQPFRVRSFRFQWPADLLACDAVLLGTTENLGYMSGALKDFFDRTYDDALPLALNLPYALFVSAGNDGTGAVREIERILRGTALPRTHVIGKFPPRGGVTPSKPA